MAIRWREGLRGGYGRFGLLESRRMFGLGKRLPVYLRLCSTGLWVIVQMLKADERYCDDGESVYRDSGLEGEVLRREL